MHFSLNALSRFELMTEGERTSARRRNREAYANRGNSEPDGAPPYEPGSPDKGSSNDHGAIQIDRSISPSANTHVLQSRPRAPRRAQARQAPTSHAMAPAELANSIHRRAKLSECA